MSRRQIIALDFDGVINPYLKGWVKEDIIPEAPVEGAQEFINDLVKNYRVVVFSSRAKTEAGKQAIIDYLNKYDIHVDDVTNTKPAAFLTIDDRAICFEGTYDGLREQIDNFSPWNK